MAEGAAGYLVPFIVGCLGAVSVSCSVIPLRAANWGLVAGGAVESLVFFFFNDKCLVAVCSLWFRLLCCSKGGIFLLQYCRRTLWKKENFDRKFKYKSFFKIFSNSTWWKYFILFIPNFRSFYIRIILKTRVHRKKGLSLQQREFGEWTKRSWIHLQSHTLLIFFWV